MKIIETNGLTKYYGKSRGIIDVTLSVDKGDIFGFIGPNGAGKSTFIRTLLGLIAPSSGSARVFGKDITESKIDILSNIGYLPSETEFYNGMKVKDILKLSADLHRKNCDDESKILCERLMLDTQKKVNELSLGNRKKVGIVCALQHKPSLYIFDEPTSGLDPLMQKEFYNIVAERNNEGATVFLSSHALSEISRYCNRAAVIREGRILACDSVASLGHTGVKRVTLKGIDPTVNFEGMSDVSIDGDIVRFLYSKSANELLRELSSLTFDDINISDPELDEVIMHFYAKEDN